MSFALLSNELIAEIFSHLEQADYLQLSLCCHGFRDVAEPFLYGVFVQRWKGDLGLFLRSLMERPGRAKYLKHFTGSMVHSDIYRIREPGALNLSSYLSESSRRDWILDQLPKTIFWPSRINPWQIHLCNDFYWDPICAFLLWICSENLQSIKMDSYGVEVADSINYLFQQVQIARQNPALPNPFPKLRRLELGNDDEEVWTYLNAEFSILQLNTIKQFTANRLNIESVPVGMSFEVEVVTFKSANIRTAHVKDFLLCFTKMKCLRYEHTDNFRAERLWPSSVRLGLQNSKHCLEKLVLCNTGQRWRPIPARPEYLLGLGSDFESLRYLDVSSRSMFGVEYDNTGPAPRMVYDLHWTEEVFRTEYMLDYLSCQSFVLSLPPRLETLILRECTAAIYSFLGVLMFGHDGRTGALKMLELEFVPRFQPGDWTEKRWYKEALRRGIEVEVTHPEFIEQPALAMGG